MVNDTIQKFSAASSQKVKFCKDNGFKYFLLSTLAGVYVGIGIILIFSIAGPLVSSSSPYTKMLMGASFAVALILVIFAGSELFTGNTMVLTIGSLSKKNSWFNTIKLWIICYFGNLAGAVFLSFLIASAGIFASDMGVEHFIVKTAIAKGTAPFIPLFVKGILCNLLVCLAVWTSARTTNDMAKLTLIFWCLFSFITSGFEHSIANMTIISIGAFISESVNWGHLVHNLIPVTLGNMVGGIGLGAIYWFISNGDSVKKEEK